MGYKWVFAAAAQFRRVLDFWFVPAEHGQKAEYEEYPARFPALRQWLYGEAPIAGRLFRELMLNFLNRNQLARGELLVGEWTVHLKRLPAPLLNVVAQCDEVVHARSSMPLIDLAGGEDKSAWGFPVGHIGMALSDEAHARLWATIGAWLRSRTEGP